MFDVGGGELLLIVLAVLLLFGPKKLPEFARTINKGLRKVKQAQSQFQTQLNDLQNEFESSIEGEDKNNPSKNDFKVKPPPESVNKVGAFDQLNLDDNFVTEYEKPKSDDIANTPSDSSTEENSETTNTNKNKDNS